MTKKAKVDVSTPLALIGEAVAKELNRNGTTGQMLADRFNVDKKLINQVATYLRKKGVQIPKRKKMGELDAVVEKLKEESPELVA